LITLTILGEEYKPCSSSLFSFLQPPVTSSLLGPNILLYTLFSNTLNLCSSLNVRDKVFLRETPTVNKGKSPKFREGKRMLTVSSKEQSLYPL
jgi:hypothetical protein